MSESGGAALANPEDAKVSAQGPDGHRGSSMMHEAQSRAAAAEVSIAHCSVQSFAKSHTTRPDSKDHAV